MPAAREVQNGLVQSGDVIGFTISKTGLVVVSNASNDQGVFDLELLALRRNISNSTDDYAALKPSIPFDNDNNYQVLSPGFYALRVVTANNIIVTVTE